MPNCFGHFGTGAKMSLDILALVPKCLATLVLNVRMIIIIINDNVYGAVLMTMVTARVHPVHLMNAD